MNEFILILEVLSIIISLIALILGVKNIKDTRKKSYEEFNLKLKKRRKNKWT